MKKKVYGSYKKEICVICGVSATAKNDQGLTVCQNHKKENLTDLKCVCGDYLDVMTGKYGAFFRCFNCGAINLNKGLEMNGYPLKSIEDL
ncbi:MAG: hypothetical protein ACMXX6_00285 [Candidatus Woesearchaeota archaeon]